MSVAAPAPARNRLRRALAHLGRGTRQRLRFLLLLAALAWGVPREAVRPINWRRTVRAEFRRVLRQAVGGGLAATLVTAVLTGLAMVSQTLYWLGEAGEGGLIGSVIVVVIVRELAPILIGFILLGRSGMLAVAEIAQLSAGGQVETLAAQGLDPFLLLVLPRAAALAVAAFTLAMVFLPIALTTGFVAGSLLGALTASLWSFLDGVLQAMQRSDFILFPVKMVLMGLLVALTAALTGLEAGPHDDAAHGLPRGFVRGTLAILFVSIVFSFAA